MHHPAFDQFRYDEDFGCWEAYLPLETLGIYAVRDPAGEPFLGEEHAGLEPFEALPLEQDDLADAEEDRFEGTDWDDEEEQLWWEREQTRLRRDAHYRREGLFPVRITTPPEAAPSRWQNATLGFLIDYELRVCSDLTQALLDSVEAYDLNSQRQPQGEPEILEPEDLRLVCHLTEIDIRPEHQGGFAYCIVHVDSDWELEHGMYVVYHPATGAEWMTGEGILEQFGDEEA